MSTLKARNIEPATGTDVALGASGDTVTVSGDSLTLDTFKDSGGNTLFTSNGSGTLSSVNSALAGNGPVLISSQTASSSSSVAFTSGIDSTYDRYMFVFVDINPATDNQTFSFQCSIDGGSNYNVTQTTTYFRAYHFEDASAAGIGYITGNDIAQSTGFQLIGDSGGNGADESLSGILHLFSPSSTTYVKHWYCRTSTYSYHNASIDTFTAGYFNDADDDINAIQFKMPSGNFDGKIKMYGIA